MRRILLSILLPIALASCHHDDYNGEVLAERYALEDMVARVSQELAEIGFSVDTTKIGIDIKESNDMAAMFNQISDESKREVKAYTPFGPTVKSSMTKSSRLAFYDPNTKTIVFLRGASQHLTDGYLAHELTHVYQDQKWGFDDIWQSYQDHPSREAFNITQFIIEGHSELVRQAYEQRYAKDERSSSLLKLHLGEIYENDCLVCDFDQPTANLPYSLGMRFLLQQYRLGGWPLVEQLFEALPGSTEQVIHPNKYKSDEPTILSLPEWEDDRPGTQLILNGSLGEAFLLSKLIDMGMDKEIAFASASGWDGDTAQIYRTSDGQEVLVWRILFDRVADAKQMESAISPQAGSEDVLRTGRVVDWLVSDNFDLKNHLRLFLSKNPLVTEANPYDEKSTIEQEVLIHNDADRWPTSYLKQKVIMGPNN